MDVLNRKWLTQGNKTSQFETEFATYLGDHAHCVAVSSCTAALHMALLLGEIAQGDEVILPGLTFVADLNVVWMTGAVPVVADATSLTDWNIDPDDIERKITGKTRALMVVHFAGYPCDMERIIHLCQKHNIVLIEDAAHAVGASISGKKCGNWGDFGCFSFFSNKNLAVGEGGMLSIKNDQLSQKARLLRSHGLSHSTIDRHRNLAKSYDVLMPGLNYRIDEMRSAIGLIQLSKLDSMNRKRQELSHLYRIALKEIHEIAIPWENLSTSAAPCYHIFPVLLPQKTDRFRFMEYMNNHGIQTSIHYPSFKDFSFYRDKISDPLPVSSEISRRVVTLPLYPGMSAEDIHYITDRITTFFK